MSLAKQTLTQNVYAFLALTRVVKYFALSQEQAQSMQKLVAGYWQGKVVDPASLPGVGSSKNASSYQDIILKNEQ